MRFTSSYPRKRDVLQGAFWLLVLLVLRASLSAIRAASAIYQKFGKLKKTFRARIYKRSPAPEASYSLGRDMLRRAFWLSAFLVLRAFLSAAWVASAIRKKLGKSWKRLRTHTSEKPLYSGERELSKPLHPDEPLTLDERKTVGEIFGSLALLTCALLSSAWFASFVPYHSPWSAWLIYFFTSLLLFPSSFLFWPGVRLLCSTLFKRR